MNRKKRSLVGRVIILMFVLLVIQTLPHAKGSNGFFIYLPNLLKNSGDVPSPTPGPLPTPTQPPPTAEPKIAYQRGATGLGTYQLYTMDPDGSDQTYVTNIDTNLRWAPNGLMFAYQSGVTVGYETHYEIFTVNVDGSNDQRITSTAGEDEKPSWSPDSSQIVCEHETLINIVNVDGSGEQSITDNEGGDYDPVWSPDGSKIAYECIQGSDGEICTIDPDGTNEVILTANFVDDSSPQWSPDGSKILYKSGGDVYVMDADGSNQTNLNDSNPDAEYGMWSPDSSKIAFSDSVGYAHSEIFVMNADGSGLEQITHVGDRNHDPTWSPDSSQVAFASDHDGNWEIYVIGVDGTGLQNLTNTSAYDENSPLWWGP